MIYFLKENYKNTFYYSWEEKWRMRKPVCQADLNCLCGLTSSCSWLTKTKRETVWAKCLILTDQRCSCFRKVILSVMISTFNYLSDVLPRFKRCWFVSQVRQLWLQVLVLCFSAQGKKKKASCFQLCLMQNVSPSLHFSLRFPKTHYFTCTYVHTHKTGSRCQHAIIALQHYMYTQTFMFRTVFASTANISSNWCCNWIIRHTVKVYQILTCC